MDLVFNKAKNKDDIKKILDHNIDAFSDTPDFEWTFEDIQREVDEGWELYAVHLGAEVIAAVFIKAEADGLLSKNTSVKMNFQGSGYSHKIKEFIEDKAREFKLKSIYHYCRIDNFRMYSLNESHGYTKTTRRLGEKGQVVEWVKKLK